MPRFLAIRSLRRPVRTALLVVAALLVLPGLALAQRPFEVLDPFYQEESAQRTFYDGFAFSGEVGYRSSGPFRPSPDADARGPLALSFRLDYALTRQLDLSAVFDVSGGLVSQLGGGPVGLSWIVVKPYWRNEDTDYALRIAVDPVSEGGLGFRQTDIAFISTSNLSPRVSSDFAVGLRRAHVGVERLQVIEAPGEGLGLGAAETALVRTRAIGREIHAMWSHNFHFDPAGSSVFITARVEAMDYDLVASRPFDEADEEAEDEPGEASSRYRGGVGWVRVGMELNRPGYQFSPFVGVPMAAWLDTAGESNTWGPRFQNLRFGLRLTLR